MVEWSVPSCEDDDSVPPLASRRKHTHVTRVDRQAHFRTDFFFSRLRLLEHSLKTKGAVTCAQGVSACVKMIRRTGMMTGEGSFPGRGREQTPARALTLTLTLPLPPSPVPSFLSARLSPDCLTHRPLPALPCSVRRPISGPLSQQLGGSDLRRVHEDGASYTYSSYLFCTLTILLFRLGR